MHNRAIRFFALPALTVFAPLAVHAASLITNGDFDNTESSWVDNTGMGGDDLQTAGGTLAPGWSAVPGRANDIWIATPNAYSVTNSPSNASGYFIHLPGQADGKPYGGIQQTFATQIG